MNALRVLALGVVVGLAAGGAGCTPGGSCLAGQSQACTCTSGASGKQVCGSDETYGTCQCGTVDSGSDFDAGPTPQCAESCESIAGASCNALTQQGSCVTTTVQVENGQTFSGGSISPGTYVLDTMTFTSTPPTEFTFAMTLQVTQTGTNSYDFELIQSGTTCPEQRLSYSFVTQGGGYTLAETCPNAGCADSVTCGENAEYLVESPCRFTLSGGFGYLQQLHFVKAGSCQP